MEPDAQVAREGGDTQGAESSTQALLTVTKEMVKISRADKRFSCLETKTLAAANILERYDLQQYIFNCPDAFCEELGQELKIIAKEEPPSEHVGDRIDLVAIDRDGDV